MTSQTPIFLLTDFGIKDPYVGIMKAQMLKVNPQAVMIDLCHEVIQGDVRQGIFWLTAAVEYLPERCICVAVVDPTVGSDRRTVIIRWGQRYFVGPDNGLFSWLYQTPYLDLQDPIELFAINREWLQNELPEIPRRKGKTFDGRDLFAPAAAWLARKIEQGSLPTSSDWLLKICSPATPDSSASLLAGDDSRTAMGDSISPIISTKVIVIDHFGNLMTDLVVQGFNQKVSISIAGLSCRWVQHYAEGKAGELIALRGSFGTLEIAVKNASAAAHVLSQTKEAPAKDGESLESILRKTEVLIHP